MALAAAHLAVTAANLFIPEPVMIFHERMYELLNLPAGHELDAAVATEVMGWVPEPLWYWDGVVWSSPDPYAIHAIQFHETSKRLLVCDQSGAHYVERFLPSTDRLCAVHVLDRFGGWNIIKNWGRYYVEIHHESGNITAASFDLCLSICRATLKATSFFEKNSTRTDPESPPSSL